ncbi:MAG: MFS transporter [Actinobacteria bacterium]|nr:MFS transporter [Actinomycetota bacterium]
MPASDDPSVVRRAQLADLARAIPLGILLPLESSVLVTIALIHFDAPGVIKGVVAAANGVGLLATPLITSVARRWGRPVMVPVAALSMIGTLGFLAAATGSLPLFVVGSVVGVAMVNGMYPLMTVSYERNFPLHELGRRVGWGLSLKVLVSASAGLAMGGYLKAAPDKWWVVVLCGAAASAVLVALNLTVPSEPLPRVAGVRNNAFPHFHLLGEDRRMRLTLAAWMLMGFGNLMLSPLRVEYLGNSRYGIGADAAKIVVLTVVVPSVVRLLTMPLFGIVFDRLSFFSARILVNVLFATYVAAFFTGTSDASLLIGSIVLGVGSAGGDLMWSLWVTKFAPPGRTADYMGLHTFFTGIRAVAAPITGFAIIGHVPLGSVALMAAGLMLTASFVLVPEMRAERSARQATSHVSLGG